MMLFLLEYVLPDLVDSVRAHRKSTVASLPVERALHASICIQPISRISFDQLYGFCQRLAFRQLKKAMDMIFHTPYND